MCKGVYFSRILIILFSFFSIAIIPSCHVGRYFVWNFADVKDYKKFPADTISIADKQFRFIENNKNISLSIPDTFNKKGEDFETFLEKKKTLGFLIIRNDTIIYENYFSDYNEAKIHPSFSLSKAFLSTLTGIAVYEGYINSVNQPVTDFIPELRDTNFNKVTIENLLNMRSGLKFKESYGSPFAKVGKFYYGRDLGKYTLKLKTNKTPGQEYQYQSANTQLLSMAVENATSMPISEYLEQKIWHPLGMEYYSTWSYDSEKNKTIKSFCCLNARARDFAKLGRLYLKKGNWEGKQIISSDWIKTSTSVINNSVDKKGYHYTYFWRIMDSGSYFSKGLLGQYIWINPDKNIIIVKLGKGYANTRWPDLFEKLCDQL
jgi:CubicO group peptidase (beta-lactamase class C family)